MVPKISPWEKLKPYTWEFQIGNPIRIGNLTNTPSVHENPNKKIYNQIFKIGIGSE